MSDAPQPSATQAKKRSRSEGWAERGRAERDWGAGHRTITDEAHRIVSASTFYSKLEYWRIVAQLKKGIVADAHPLLLCLDVNGLLIHRERNAGDARDGYRRIGDTPYTFRARPGASSFVDWCLRHFAVGVWSSMQEENVHATLLALLGAKRCEKLLFVWGRARTTPAGEGAPAGGLQPDGSWEKELRYKRLADLWEQVPGAARYAGSATLLIDDDAAKAAANPPHLLACPAAWDPAVEGDGTLFTGRDFGPLASYLERMRRHVAASAAAAPDIRPWVEANPFGPLAAACAPFGTLAGDEARPPPNNRERKK